MESTVHAFSDQRSAFRSALMSLRGAWRRSNLMVGWIKRQCDCFSFLGRIAMTLKSGICHEHLQYASRRMIGWPTSANLPRLEPVPSSTKDDGELISVGFAALHPPCVATKKWCLQGKSNPCLRLERAVS